MKLQQLFERPEREPGEPYKTINDASKIVPSMKKGKTKIWYVKPKYTRDFIMGGDWAEKRGILPTDESDLKETHTLLGSIAETDLNKIFVIMQGEVWSPSGEARNVIDKLKLHHTSMSVGDIIQISKRILMIDSRGYKDLTQN